MKTYPASTRITVGILLANSIRNLLNTAKFNDYEIEWMETDGWIQRTFLIKGSVVHIRALNRIFQKMIEEYEHEEAENQLARKLEKDRKRWWQFWK
jgi:hypothetical protein